MKLQNIIAEQGEKSIGYLEVPGTELKLPATLICGVHDGKTVLITGGVHNVEYVGIQAAIELAGSIDPKEVTGNLIIIPLINRSGFEHRTMSLVYEDGKNLNRQFPGDASGTTAQKLAYFMEKELFSQADFYIDLHCGDGFEELTPFVFAQGNAEEYINEQSLRMAKAVDVPYIIRSQARTGAYNYAGLCGIPGILVERGCSGLWSKNEVELYKKDIKNVLRVLKVLSGEDETTQDKTIFDRVIYENSSHVGCWYPQFSSGDRIRAGDILGVTKDYFGQELFSCVAKADGVIFHQIIGLNILQNDPMIAYGVLESGDVNYGENK